MHPVDEVAGVEDVGLPRAGTTAADVDAGNGSPRRGDDDGHPRQPARLVPGAVADTQSRDVDERVRRAGRGDPGRTAHRGSRRSNSMSRPGEVKPSRS